MLTHSLCCKGENIKCKAITPHWPSSLVELDLGKSVFHLCQHCPLLSRYIQTSQNSFTYYNMLLNYFISCVFFSSPLQKLCVDSWDPDLGELPDNLSFLTVRGYVQEYTALPLSLTHLSINNVWYLSIFFLFLTSFFCWMLTIVL